MVSGSNKLPRLLLTALLVLAGLLQFAGPVNADPDYKQLKTEISNLERAVEDATKARNDADAKLVENRTAQGKASGDKLATLKKEAITLAQTASEKADAQNVAQQNLLSKQGELRETAAAHAVKQLTDPGDIDVRVGEAANAVNDWRDALGTLPGVPPLRSLEGIEPDDQPTIRSGDKKKLEAYEKWAAAEEARIDKEIKQAKEIIDGEAKLKSAKDGGVELVSDTKSLKETLEARKKSVAALRQSAKDTIRQIK